MLMQCYAKLTYFEFILALCQAHVGPIWQILWQSWAYARLVLELHLFRFIHAYMYFSLLILMIYV